VGGACTIAHPLASNIAQTFVNGARNGDCASLPRKAPAPLPATINGSATTAGTPLLHPFQAMMRTMTHYTLGTAANACGLNKSTVLRAIKAGKISATRDEHRVYPPVASTPQSNGASNVTRRRSNAIVRTTRFRRAWRWMRAAG
jgi:hypothetical protein